MNSSLRAASFEDESTSLTGSGMTLMPRCLSESTYGAALLMAFDTCPLLPLIMTGRTEPLSASRVTTLFEPMLTCRATNFSDELLIIERIAILLSKVLNKHTIVSLVVLLSA